MTVIKGKRVGLKEIAEQAGVSVSAVSMALAGSERIGEDTKQRVRDISQKLGYKPPRQTKRNLGAEKRFGFMSIGLDFHEESLADLLQGITTASATLGARTEISGILNLENENETLEHLLNYAQDLSGLILSGRVSTELLHNINLAGVTTVLIGTVLTTPHSTKTPYAFNSVITDNIAMGRLATDRLMELGHKHIGFICETLPDGMYNAHWLDGYRLAHHDNQLPIDQNLIQIAGSPYAGGINAAKAFTEMKNPPTAYVIPALRVAASFRTAMAENGQKISTSTTITGGRLDIARKYHMEEYPLISEDAEAMAEAALELLCRILDRKKSRPISIQVPFLTRNFNGK